MFIELSYSTLQVLPAAQSGREASGAEEQGWSDSEAVSQALDGALRRREASEGSLPPTGRTAPEPRGAGGEARKGEITSAYTLAVREGRGVMLKGDQEKIQRCDLEGEGEEQHVTWGQVIWRCYRRVYQSNVTVGTVPN